MKEPLPKFKRKSQLETTDEPKKRKEKKRKSSDEPQPLPEIQDPAQLKLTEASRDFDDALSRIKPKRVKKDLIEETAIDDMMTHMLSKMKESAEMV